MFPTIPRTVATQSGRPAQRRNHSESSGQLPLQAKGPEHGKADTDDRDNGEDV